MPEDRRDREERLTSVLNGINRMEVCVMDDAEFPCEDKAQEFKDQLETLRGHVCRLFSGELSDSEMKRVIELKNKRLLEIVETLWTSGWLDSLENSD